MKILYCLLLFSILTRPTLSQESSSQDWMKVLSYGVGNQTDQTEISLDEAAKRSKQCFPEQFSTANLILSNGSTIEHLNVKYDYKEKILLIKQENTVLIGAPNVISSITFQRSDIYPLINVNQLGRSFGRQGFYASILEKNSNHLLKYTTLKAKNVTKPNNSGQVDLYKAPEKELEYFMQVDFLIAKNQRLYLIENFKSKSLDQFDEHASLLKSYVKEEKLKFRNEEDLRKFAEYLWSL